MLAYIPSPSANGFNIGPLRLHVYGFLIVCGVFAAVWLADRRWRARGGEPGTFSNIAVWAVPAGLIGARLYSVFTDYELYDHDPLNALKIWQGGLGIWGGIAGGALGAWLYVRRHHMDFAAIADTVAPALPLAQAIGRWGNYFNQELFGRPTSLPWGLKINPSIVANLFSNVNKQVPLAYSNAKAFQPTFLYECIWDLCVVGLVLLAEKHLRLRKGYLFWVYVSAYCFGRFFTEYLRIDFAHKILGLRFNDWVSIIVFVFATVLVLVKGRVRGDSESDATAGADSPKRASVAVAAGGGMVEEGGAEPESKDVIGYESGQVAPVDTEADVADVADAEPPAASAEAVGPEVKTGEPASVPKAEVEPLPPAVEPLPPAVVPLPPAVEPLPPAVEPLPAVAKPVAVEPVAELDPGPVEAVEPEPVEPAGTPEPTAVTPSDEPPPV